MLKSARQFLILALLVVMPLQGIAAPLSHIFCSSSTAMSHADDGHHHDGSAGGASHGHDNTGAGDGHVDNLSCHQPASGVAGVTVAVTVEAASSYLLSNPSSPGLFFPEQPQRVPLA